MTKNEPNISFSSQLELFRKSLDEFNNKVIDINNSYFELVKSKKLFI